MEALIRAITSKEEAWGYKLRDLNISVLGYADDLALIGRSKATLQTMLDLMYRVADWLGLKFKPA